MTLSTVAAGSQDQRPDPVRVRLAGAVLLAWGMAAAAVAAPAPDPEPTPSLSAPGPQSYTLTPEKYQKAIAYAKARYRLHFAAFAYGLSVLLLLVALRLPPKYRDWAERGSRRRFGQVAIFVPLLLFTQGVLELPVGAYRHRLALAYDQSVQGWGSWLWDWVKGSLVGIAITLLIVWGIYGLIRRSERRWWMKAWLFSLPVIVFLVFLAPYVIDPLFFRFEPLAAKQPELTEKIEQVTRRGGLSIPRERMFEMNASAKYKSINAYVTGIGPSKRVVVWDTTISRATPPQTLFVFGHEMGHYVLHHVWKTILFLWGLLLAAFWVLDRSSRRALSRWGGRWGIRGLGDLASLPVLLLLLAVFSEVGLPIVNGYSRGQERAADIYGLEVIHGIVPDSPRAAAEAFQVLGEVNLSDPDPSAFIRFWLYSHPPLAERLRFAAAYDPWGKGEPTRYVKGDVNGKS
ncbi:MAG: M48 family metallopeptidase [Thermoanaerobaculia bacterium]